jgi:hypothetical protein
MGVTNFLARVYKGLFTHEDKFNAHKTLGFSCLLSYAYRFSQAGERDMGFSSSYGSLFCILLHMTLSVSSLIFRIPSKRTLSMYRIWPEYRLHSIIFAWRVLLTMLQFWVEGKFGLEPQYAFNTATMVICFMASDYATYSVGDNASRSIRDLDVPPVVQFAFSWLQFHMTFNVIFSVRRYSSFFIYVWIIQLNAFLMTLQRKNLCPSAILYSVYAFMLTFGYVVITGEMLRVGWPYYFAANAIANISAILRMSGSWIGGKKYLMWLTVSCVTHLLHNSSADFVTAETPYFYHWAGACSLSYALLIRLGYKKIAGKYYAKDEKGAWKGGDGSTSPTSVAEKTPEKTQ